ncbi:MAG: four helix bundle protein [Ignavibacteriaceae bacterium]|jgi:four helix bundle protein|nr:four helix bundle protein [Ignavibacteriaceae bacterium]
MINHFSDLKIWISAKSIYLEIFKMFDSYKDYFFRSQILRATLSISNNIAEGFGRRSKKEFIQFLMISKGSCNEVESMLLIAKDLGEFKNYDIDKLIIDLRNNHNSIGALVHSLQQQLDSKQKKQ